MRLLISMLLLWSFPLSAQTIQIQQLDEDFNAEELTKATGKNVKSTSLKEFNARKDTKTFPKNSEVVQIMMRAGLESEAKNFDSFARDQLYKRAGYFSVEKLSELYPDSSKENLKKYIEIVLGRSK